VALLLWRTIRTIEDTYWTEDDYTGALVQAGLTVTTITYPLPPDPSAWSTDEASIPPCIVIEAMKAALRRHLAAPAAIRLAEEAARHSPDIPIFVRRSWECTQARMIVPAG
jgi:hypothetical protein